MRSKAGQSQVQGRNGKDGWLFWPLFGVSLAMHLGFVGTMLRQTATGDFGAVPSPTTAISVNIERTAILDASDERRDTAACAQQAPAARQDYREEKAREAPPPEPEKDNAERVAEEETRRAETERLAEQERLRLTEEALREAERAEREAQQRRIEEERRIAEEVRQKELAEAQERERIAQAEDRKRDDQEEQQAQEQRDAVQGSAGMEASSGQVSASQGAMRRYGAVLQARVARKKPAGGGRGRVVIGFGLSTTGDLTYLRVVSSSGDNSLDERALRAIRAASPFPPPPPEARDGQLQYTFPFTFR
jgi:TonB family protein